MGWDENGQFAFVTKAKDPKGHPLDDALVPQGILGRERISRLYEYHVLFRVREDHGPLSREEIDALLLAPAAVALGRQEGDIVARGVVAWIEQVDTATASYSYAAKLVPHVSLLAHARTSRVFLGKSPVDIVTEVLGEYGLKQTDRTTFRQLDVSAAAREAREYVVQYEESDWDFVQRWLEREGIFYWFEAGKKGEQLVLADHNARFTEHEADIPWARNPEGEAAALSDLCARRQRLAARVELLDYTDRSPTALVRGRSPVDGHIGFGTVFSFGEHLTGKSEADRLAKARAERLLAERDTYTASVNFVRLRAGHVFRLVGHDAAGRYVVTGAEHRVGRRFRVEERTAFRSERIVVEREPGQRAMGDRILGRLELVSCEDQEHPDRVVYRPERLTPWPRIDGVLLGHIEEDTEGKYAQLDPEGRYRVKLPFDLSGHAGSRASHWVRMAEPYTGRGYGTHFPLHRGAEVLLAHVGGDPDRPLIVAAVPNPETTSPVIDETSTQSRIRTASGIQIEMEDREG